MEKVEKNLIANTKKGKNMIKASSILEITLEDYHQSRKLYGQDNKVSNFNSGKNNFNNNNENERQPTVNENLFDEFDNETNQFNASGGKKPNMSLMNKFKDEGENNSDMNNQGSQDNSGNQGNINNNTNSAEKKVDVLPKNQNEKIGVLKNLIFNYIKEKELDM